MPRISKARIVNFSYNDGNRLIADELFDFENIDHDDALNVLINLANGGGKSVLVQLMMQPVLPKAKVAGRRIESFFSAATDHYFVVLEWLKDNSREKLLTGISMGARQSSPGEDEMNRGISARYYTFCAEYLDEACPYSIVNLPLSGKDHGRFLPAQYESIRDLARKSKTVLRCFSQDDNPQWQKKLSEYGLVQDEWKMIQDLNSEEGGLGKYFGNFKNSEALMERLLIPTIERKQNSMTSSEDSSLATMLLSHVEETVKHQDSLSTKKKYETFVAQLEQLKPKAEDLWNSHDDAQRALADLFGLMDAIDAEESVLEKAKEKTTVQINDLQQQENHISWEQTSAKYYSAKEALDDAAANYQNADNSFRYAETQLHDIQTALLAQECAGYLQKQKSLQSRIDSLQKAIVIQEQGGDHAAEIARLKYSAQCAAHEELQNAVPQMNAWKANQTAVWEKQKQNKTECQLASAALEAANQDLYRCQGQQEMAFQQTDTAILALDLDFQRRLDGAYAADELTEYTTNQKNELAQNEADTISLQSALSDLEQKQNLLPQQIAQAITESDAAKNRCSVLQTELDRYHMQEEQLKAVFSCYSLDFELRFGSHLTDFLIAEQRNVSASQIDLRRKMDIVQAQIQAVDRGSVHVPDAVIQYLKATQIPFSTGEKYLQDLMETGKLEHQACLKILENYPAIAYGILMHEKDKAALADQEREKWLPAMVPIFDYTQMDAILHLNKRFSGSIAFYSEEYFADRAHYRSGLIEQQKNLIQTQNHLAETASQLEKHLELAKAFCFESDWEKLQQERLAQQKKSAESWEENRRKLEADQKELAAQHNTLTKKIGEGQRKCWCIQQTLDKLQEIEQLMQKEQALLQCIGEKRKKKEEAAQRDAQARQQSDLLNQEESELSAHIQTLKAQLDKLQQVLQKLGDCAKADLVEGDWLSLYQQYESMQESASQELISLRKQLDECQARYTDAQNEINKRSLPAEAYQTLVYDAQQEASLRRQENQMNLEAEAARTARESASTIKAKAEASCEQAEHLTEPFGGILDKSQISGNFENRIQKVRNAMTLSYEENKKRDSRLDDLAKKYSQLEIFLQEKARPESVPEIALASNCTEQMNAMKARLAQFREKENHVCADVSQTLETMSQHFPPDESRTAEAVSGMQDILKGSRRGDSYYTLVLQISAHIDNVNRAIAQIDTNLREFQNSRRDLVTHCTLQGKRIYDGLQQMENSSRVTVHAGKPRQKMIRFNMPDEVDSLVAESSIADEIDMGVHQLLEMRNNHESDFALKKYAKSIVGSSTLLHKYIRQDTISVEAYKIDQNPQNSKYRSWEKTQVNNSGAEKFVVYFAVILSLINYTRSDLNMIQEKALHSTLILDNPFGATSSEHILTPMFAIAKHFRVQMICLSDINKADVINCFDTVIKAIVKRRPLSNNEMLTHEGNERIEHGYYRSEQISLLDS